MTLGVLATDHVALPAVTWQPADQVEELFGLKLAYYNPNHNNMRPQRNQEACIGFYGVETANTNPELVCDLHPEHIVSVILLPGTPGEAMSLFQKQGWQACKALAVRALHPNHQNAIAA